MHSPTFTATKSLYRSAHTYRSPAQGPSPLAAFSPAEGYTCVGASCTCSGAEDCIGCVVGGHCTASCTCTDTSCVCEREPADYR